MRNSDSTKALSSLTGGPEYEGFTPSQWSIASTMAVQGGPVVAVQHRLRLQGVDAFGERRAPHQVRGMGQANPRRWSGATRNWSPIEVVTLNPERDAVVTAAAATVPKERLIA